jgi:hypothetical protein
MVNRAGLKDGNFTAHYIDIFDIERALKPVNTGASHISYEKIPRTR